METNWGRPGKEACLLSEENIEKVLVTAAKGKAALLSQTGSFLRKVKEEMRLLSRPSWNEVRSTTTVVMVFVFLFAFYLKALDVVFISLYRWLFPH
jgi:preprotein translocase SecE subunit